MGCPPLTLGGWLSATLDLRWQVAVYNSERDDDADLRNVSQVPLCWVSSRVAALIILWKSFSNNLWIATHKHLLTSFNICDMIWSHTHTSKHTHTHMLNACIHMYTHTNTDGAPWYNHSGWLGIKHWLTSLLSYNRTQHQTYVCVSQGYVCMCFPGLCMYVFPMTRILRRDLTTVVDWA